MAERRRKKRKLQSKVSYEVFFATEWFDPAHHFVTESTEANFSLHRIKNQKSKLATKKDKRYKKIRQKNVIGKGGEIAVICHFLLPFENFEAARSYVPAQVVREIQCIT